MHLSGEQLGMGTDGGHCSGLDWGLPEPMEQGLAGKKQLHVHGAHKAAYERAGEGHFTGALSDRTGGKGVGVGGTLGRNSST